MGESLVQKARIARTRTSLMLRVSQVSVTVALLVIGQNSSAQGQPATIDPEDQSQPHVALPSKHGLRGGRNIGADCNLSAMSTISSCDAAIAETIRKLAQLKSLRMSDP